MPDRASDEIVVRGVSARGFGVIPALVMECSADVLSCEAKAIYAFMASKTGGGGSITFPGVALMMKRLGMGQARFYKHRKMLEDCGLLTVRRGKREGSKWEHNIYELNADVEFVTTHDGDIIPMRRPSDELIGAGRVMENPTYPQVNGAVDFDTTQDSLIVENPTYPQVNGAVDFGTVQNRTTNSTTSNSIKTSNSPISVTKTNARDAEPEADEVFDGLCLVSRNRNRLGGSGLAETRRAYDSLLDAGYQRGEIEAAWVETMRLCEEDGRKASFYPQLCSWLRSADSSGRHRAGARERIELTRRGRAQTAEGMEADKQPARREAEILQVRRTTSDDRLKEALARADSRYAGLRERALTSRGEERDVAHQLEFTYFEKHRREAALAILTLRERVELAVTGTS